MAEEQSLFCHLYIQLSGKKTLFNLCSSYNGWEGVLAPRQVAYKQLQRFIATAIAQCVIKAKRSFYLSAKQDESGPWGESGPRCRLRVMLDM